MRDWTSIYEDVFNNDAGYFLGSFIVIQSEMDPKTGIVDSEVIDGQQRITTISLLLAVVYARLQEHGGAIDDVRAEELVPLRNRLVLKQDKSMTRVIPQLQSHNLERISTHIQRLAVLRCCAWWARGCPRSPVCEPQR